MIILIAIVPSSQALPGFLITAHPSVCVSAVLVSLTVWIQNQKIKKKNTMDPNKWPSGKEACKFGTTNFGTGWQQQFLVCMLTFLQ